MNIQPLWWFLFLPIVWSEATLGCDYFKSLECGLYTDPFCMALGGGDLALNNGMD